MKLGIAYTVFSGEELLPFAIKAIRPLVDFISVVYQTTSYHGNQHDPLETIRRCPVDKAIHFQPDLSLPFRANELANRNAGLRASKDAGCTHHISADVDEFYEPGQFANAKDSVADCDCSVARMVTYFKHPTYRVVPSPKHFTTFIQSVNNPFVMGEPFPFPVEVTRRSRSSKVKLLDDLVIHHMSFVRRDIGKKVANSAGNQRRNTEEFLAMFDKYKVGDWLRIPPDEIRRKTKLVEDIFAIGELT